MTAADIEVFDFRRRKKYQGPAVGTEFKQVAAGFASRTILVKVQFYHIAAIGKSAMQECSLVFMDKRAYKSTFFRKAAVVGVAAIAPFEFRKSRAEMYSCERSLVQQVGISDGTPAVAAKFNNLFAKKIIRVGAPYQQPAGIVLYIAFQGCNCVLNMSSKCET